MPKILIFLILLGWIATFDPEIVDFAKPYFQTFGYMLKIVYNNWDMPQVSWLGRP